MSSDPNPFAFFVLFFVVVVCSIQLSELRNVLPVLLAHSASAQRTLRAECRDTT